MLKPFTELAFSGKDLTTEQAQTAAEYLTLPEVTLDDKKDFLLALAQKGETATEVEAFARTFRKHAINPEVEKWSDRAIDVCGTGGDGSGTFNISTAVSFIIAASGIPVFKHGNRSITSQCGSADLLEALGIQINLPPDQIQKSLNELNFCFFFAPTYHPAFKEVMPVRRALAEDGQRTIFNLLGPLINPGRPAHQLLGVFAQRWVQPLADALGGLGLKSGLVVHGRSERDDALDELSCSGTNYLAGFGQASSAAKTLVPEDVGLDKCNFSDLKGGNVVKNIEIMHALLSGSVDAIPAGLRNSILLNTGIALWISGATTEISAGITLASETLGNGTVRQWLKKAQAFYKNT